MQFQTSLTRVNPVEDVWPQEQKLDSLHPTFRAKVDRVMADLRAQGYNPHVKFGWRSLETQAQLFNAGTTKVLFSFHNAVDLDGEPAALAVDITDEADQWAYANMAFFNALGVAAKKQGLFWGGDWMWKDYAHIQGAPNDVLNLLKTKGLAAIGYASRVKYLKLLGGVGLVGVAAAASAVIIALAWRYRSRR